MWRTILKSAKKIVALDSEYIWHPASQMSDYEAYPALPIVKGKGSYLYTADGHKILDIISSWWCNLLGHCNEEISDALAKQAKTLEHVIFADLTHPYAVKLIKKLLDILPEGLCRFNFADNGSSAIEMALKIAFQYQMQIGQSQRIKFACLTEGYHGETIGALSVGSMDLYSQIYKPMLMQNIHIEAPDCFRCPYGCKRGQCQVQCLNKAREIFEREGKNLAALIVEPLLQGAAGMRIYPEAYLQGLSKLCKEYGVLLIADEIATGFGRTGEMFACTKAKVTPDIMTLSKAITGGYMPMSLVCTTKDIYDAFLGSYESGKAFMHSHTYAGNPLACACALTVLKILKRDNIIEKAQKQAQYLTSRFEETFSDMKNVGEIRHIGLIHAIELVKDKESKEPYPSKMRLGYQIYREALKEGLLLRPIGNVLYFNPPLNIEKSDLDIGLKIAHKAIKNILDKL